MLEDAYKTTPTDKIPYPTADFVAPPLYEGEVLSATHQLIPPLLRTVLRLQCQFRARRARKLVREPV